MCRSILQWNINCLRTKFPRLEELLSTENVGIIALQETKNSPNREIKIRGFNVYKKDRNVRGGGVLLAVHRNIPSTPLAINSPLEIVACSVHFDSYKLTSILFYCLKQLVLLFLNSRQISNISSIP